MFDHFLHYLCDVYWMVYKRYLPKSFGCRDTGPDLFRALSVMGKLLYMFRPLMVRAKQKKDKLSIPFIKCKPPPKNKINNRLYYSLIANSLQTVFVKEIVHISEGNQSSVVFLDIFRDGTTLNTFPIDRDIIQMWINGGTVSYLFTFDTCCFPDFTDLQLPEEIERSLVVRNAGGMSDLSETFSMYYMSLKFGASHFTPEMEVNYQFDSCLCDYIMTLNDRSVGVSVTRAMSYPIDNDVTIESMRTLLSKKLNGIIVAKKRVDIRNQFDSCVIHVWCKSWTDAQSVREAYRSIVEGDIYGLYGNIYVICTICLNRFIYTNNAPHYVKP
jgi:hypothetical protein